MAPPTAYVRCRLPAALACAALAALAALAVVLGCCSPPLPGAIVGAPNRSNPLGGDDAAIAIGTLEVLEGRLPRRALALVLEWASEHRAELRDNWMRAEAHLPLNDIDPLI